MYTSKHCISLRALHLPADMLCHHTPLYIQYLAIAAVAAAAAAAGKVTAEEAGEGVGEGRGGG